MNALARHIEVLLLEHDCVVVPALGGFIANRQAAAMSKDGDGMMLPPFRSVVFNQHININDGLLAQTYMQAYDSSYPEATLQMEKDINAIVAQLDIESKVELKGIGTLKKDLNGVISLEPIDAGVLTPSLYGLDAIKPRTVKEIVKERELRRTINTGTSFIEIERPGKADEPSAAAPHCAEGASKEGNKSDDVTIKIHRRWIDISIAAAAAAAIFVLFTLPEFFTADRSETYTAGMPVPYSTNVKKLKAEQIINQDNPEKEKHQQNISEVSDKQKNISVKDNTAGTVTDTKSYYTIVLASCVSEKNANAFIENIKNQGFTEAQYVVNGNTARIVYSKFATEAEAYKQLYDLRQRNAIFHDAWIYNVKQK